MAMIPAPVSPQYCVPNIAQFLIEQKVFTISSGKFEIKDPQGNVLFTVKGKIPSLHTKRILCDPRGEHILLLTQKVLTIHDSWEVTSEKSGKTLFTMKKSSLIQLKPSFNIFLESGSDHHPDFTLKGDFFQFNYSVYHKDAIVAQVSKKLNASAIVIGKDQYIVTIQPGVDHAFIASLVVIMDQVAQANASS